MTLKRIAGLIVLALIALTAFYVVSARAATLLPPGKQVFLDANGNPLSGGQVFHYVPGTTTPKDTYQDAGSTILNTNPVILNGSGQAVIYGTGAYRQIVKDSLGNTIWDQLTADTASSSTSWAGTSGGTANAQTVTAANFTSAAGQVIGFVAGFTNTGAMTLNPNGSGGLNVLKDLGSGPVSLTGGEVVAGNVIQVIYDSTLGAFHLVSTPATSPSPANTIQSNLTNGSAAATGNTLTQVLDKLAGNAQGSLLYRNGSAWTPLGPGTSGQYLKTLGAAANPAWDYSGLVRRYYAENATYTTLSAVMNVNDTVPTTAQGTQVLSVNVVVDDATEVVRLRFKATAAVSAASGMVAAVFQGSTAIAADAVWQTNANVYMPMIVEKEIVPGAAGTYTYSVRLGPTSGTMYLNGGTTSRILGGTLVATLVAQVVKP